MAQANQAFIQALQNNTKSGSTLFNNYQGSVPINNINLALQGSNPRRAEAARRAQAVRITNRRNAFNGPDSGSLDLGALISDRQILDELQNISGVVPKFVDNYLVYGDANNGYSTNWKAARAAIAGQPNWFSPVWGLVVHYNGSVRAAKQIGKNVPNQTRLDRAVRAKVRTALRYAYQIKTSATFADALQQKAIASNRAYQDRLENRLDLYRALANQI